MRNNKPAATVPRKRPGQSCQCPDGQTVFFSRPDSVREGLLHRDCVCHCIDPLLSPMERECCEGKGRYGDGVCHCFMWQVTFYLVLWLFGSVDFVARSPFARRHSEASHSGGNAQMVVSAIGRAFLCCASVGERLRFAWRREQERGALVGAVILVWEAFSQCFFFFCFPFASKFPSLVD